VISLVARQEEGVVRDFPLTARTFHSRFRAMVLAASCAAAISPLEADTVFLKDGTQIPDCKVKSESDTHVSVTTPGGDMVVPKTEVFKILRTKTVQDTYQAQRTAIRDGDVNGLYKLALWCRSANGLRKESDDLLAEVIALKANHAEARRLLGQVKLGGEWVTPKPLSIRLKTSGAEGPDLRSALDLLLKTRKDMQLASDSGPAAEGSDTLDACNMDSSVIITRKAPGTFFGTVVGEPTYGATVRLQAKSPWIGSTLLKVNADGQVPGKGGNSGLAVHNAFGTSGAFIHRFLDQLTDLRLKKIEEDFQKKKRETKASATPLRA
jgi:hypothetical protein